MLFLVLPPAAFHRVYRDSLPIFYKFGDSPTGRVLFPGIATCQNCMYQIIQSSNMHVLDGLTRHHGIKNDAVKRVNLILTVSITVVEHLRYSRVCASNSLSTSLASWLNSRTAANRSRAGSFIRSLTCAISAEPLSTTGVLTTHFSPSKLCSVANVSSNSPTPGRGWPGASSQILGLK